MAERRGQRRFNINNNNKFIGISHCPTKGKIGSFGRDLSRARHVVYFPSSLTEDANGDAFLYHIGSLLGRNSTLVISGGSFRIGCQYGGLFYIFPKI
jgi:hypothetical protein